MIAIKPEEIVENMLQAGAKKACLTVKDMLIRGFLSGVFLGYATTLAILAMTQTGLGIVGALVFPVGFVTSFIPGGQRRVEIIVGLGIVGRVIPARPKILRERLDFGRSNHAGSHVVGPYRCRIDPGDDPRSGRSTDGGMGERV